MTILPQLQQLKEIIELKRLTQRASALSQGVTSSKRVGGVQLSSRQNNYVVQLSGGMGPQTIFYFKVCKTLFHAF
jgi:DNA-binding transcriptional regulator LsrR (DeoR family)